MSLNLTPFVKDWKWRKYKIQVQKPFKFLQLGAQCYHPTRCTMRKQKRGNIVLAFSKWVSNLVECIWFNDRHLSFMCGIGCFLNQRHVMLWFMIPTLKEEILRFASLERNHRSIYFQSSPRANFRILFAKFCTMLSTFWKVEEHSDEIGAHWKSWEEVDNGLKKLRKMESKSKVERLYNLHEPSFRNLGRNGMYLRSFFEEFPWIQSQSWITSASQFDNLR